VDDSYFQVLSEDGFRGSYRSGAATSGPWDPGLQHGGPPTALSVRAAERAAAEASGRADLIAVRISADFVGPVPVAPVEIRASVVRIARSAVLVETVLHAQQRPCLQARTWLVADTDTAAVAHVTEPRAPADDLPGLGANFPYADSIEWRAESGGLSEPGPGRIWARPRLALVDDEPLDGLQRVSLVGDSASGVSSELDWQEWSFVNVDLDVHILRPVHGPWVLLDARTQLGGHGSALTRATIFDVAGELGATAQTLVLAPRRR
jgi:acyl-coenzyme A thioesterase PaaI-like protein